MNKKFTPEERKSYMVDKLSQLDETTEALAAICFLKVEAVNQYLCGDKVIEDKDWVQLGLGLARLSKKMGVPTEKEEKASGEKIIKRVSRTSIIRRVEALDIFDAKA